MDKKLFEYIKALTEAEEEKLRKENTKSITNEPNPVYRGNIVYRGNKYLNNGKIITLHPHARTRRCANHRHDYVELAYVVQGSITHIVEGKRLEIKEGEILFLSQRAHHEILPSSENDYMINIIIKPEFFEKIFTIIGEEETPLHRFLIDCLRDYRRGAGYLYFCVENVISIQNLMENFIESMIYDVFNKVNILQTTMGLLLMHLMNYVDRLESVNTNNKTEVTVLQYIENNYRDGNLRDLADTMSYNFSGLSREIKRLTGKTYTELVQEKRLSQACFFLRNTDMSIEDISRQVGYENISFFHRIFRSRYSVSPRTYRKEAK